MPDSVRPVRGFRLGVIIALALIAVPVLILFAWFPGEQRMLAYRLATGTGIESVQARVDSIEDKAIRGTTISQDDRRFLRDLYSCLSKGACLTVVLRQSGRMMARYLDGTGEPLEVPARIFRSDRKVTQRMERMRGAATRDLLAGRPLEAKYDSGVFYMPDPSSLESVFGLYYGHMTLIPRARSGGGLACRWRAEVPWNWPPYEKLARERGDPHAECFPIPNLRALLRGHRYALMLDNGLGEYLVRLGLAKSFLVYAEWEED
jgi:hypothetical protein